MSEETKACPFCSEQILASASKCKHCGEFLNEKSKQATVIEATSKKWKTIKLLGWVLILLSFPTCIAGYQGSGTGLLAVGIIIAFVANFGSWWKHG